MGKRSTCTPSENWHRTAPGSIMIHPTFSLVGGFQPKPILKNMGQVNPWKSCPPNFSGWKFQTSLSCHHLVMDFPILFCQFTPTFSRKKTPGHLAGTPTHITMKLQSFGLLHDLLDRFDSDRSMEMGATVEMVTETTIYRKGTKVGPWKYMKPFKIRPGLIPKIRLGNNANIYLGKEHILKKKREIKHLPSINQFSRGIC